MNYRSRVVFLYRNLYLKILTLLVQFLLLTPPPTSLGVDESKETGSGLTVVDQSVDSVVVLLVVRSTGVSFTRSTDGLGYLGPLNFTFVDRDLYFNFPTRN